MKITGVLGSIVLLLSILTYSSIHRARPEMIDLKKFMICMIVIVLAIAFQGVLGFLSASNILDVYFHSFYGFSIFLIALICIMCSCLKRLKEYGCFTLGKEAFDLLIYVIVLTMFSNEIMSYLLAHFEIEIVKFFTITTVAILISILLGLSFYGLKIYRDVIALAEPINLIGPIKTACLAFAIYGAVAIFITFQKSSCIFMIIGHISLLASALQILWEVTSKYYIPSKNVRI